MLTVNPRDNDFYNLTQSKAHLATVVSTSGMCAKYVHVPVSKPTLS